MTCFFQFVQLKQAILQDKGNNFNHNDLNKNHVYQNHHVTQEGRNLFTVRAPISNTYFKTLFINSTPDLSKIYLLPHVTVIDTT